MKARKHVALVEADEVADLLQWGRADEGAETAGWTTWPSKTNGFNGAAPMKARKRIFAARSRVHGGGFNGAAPMKARKLR